MQVFDWNPFEKEEEWKKVTARYCQILLGFQAGSCIDSINASCYMVPLSFYAGLRCMQSVRCLAISLHLVGANGDQPWRWSVDVEKAIQYPGWQTARLRAAAVRMPALEGR